ncbi:hypothetical protein KIN20_006356 [Parelaphostrongylus tenuis]|uniref:Uncharacterized protein n=1 Tax=Parelaphostrongylus tenuis TaxID=148309 RepID=A0AAD5QFX2_PARTN|nr:hypothetical protein KIN20_006356 [Parelaphostrongylus tenuis]
MKIFANVVQYPMGSTMVFLLATIRTVSGCGVMPAGQAMAYTEEPNVLARVPGIATSEAGAKASVERLVMQTVFDVLESQGRNALLPDAVIATILSQLSVKTSYKPLKCQMVTSPEEMQNEADKKFCIIVGNTVTGICTTDASSQCEVHCNTAGQGDSNKRSQRSLNNIRNSLDHKHHHGKLVESDVAKCSEQSNSNAGMGSIGSHFFSAFATVN